MPTIPHIERHFTASEAVRDVVIGMADGLTVPFALAAGLGGAALATKVVVTAGLAEIAAGAIAMGLGGYLAARTDAEHYHAEYKRELNETEHLPDEERREVAEIFRSHGLDGGTLDAAVTAVTANRQRWVDFMMRFELNLDEPSPGRASRSAATIGASYVVGGLVPLLPYMLIGEPRRALIASVIVTLSALFVFGSVKGRLTGQRWLAAGAQTMAIGGLAASVAFALARMLV